ncbi:uncharacterized protein BX663DRAFT_556726 [Cokeromyces recurvatus]|uniref:uncharacterized protein n=1 Tax=Cokeromyces recurvatus TaxID=90255 RepID=UPI0022202B13|nr:uncharacterized protein BX663DRAFT_556726 [Cokeromyces recurvatus]KAI7897445.1 hypothetical protein BX663DRAFT_556726 [Cokeromyces recurvatus]
MLQRLSSLLVMSCVLRPLASPKAEGLQMNFPSSLGFAKGRRHSDECSSLRPLASPKAEGLQLNVVPFVPWLRQRPKAFR